MSKPSLNHTYRLRWHAAKRLWVVVAETTKARSKKASPSLLLRAISPLLGSLAFGASSLAFAADLPTGAQISSGAASISQNSHSLTVQQHSDKLITNWQSFDIGKNHSVNFIQPGSSSVALNRVLGNDASQIYGQLNANGQIFLINPNGVLFGHSAKVDVGGLVASTLNINDQDFLNGRYVFQAGQGAQGSITNAGTLSAKQGGAIALLGAKVSNTGLIQAQLGAVALAAGDNITLDFAGDGLLSATINQASLNALVENHGAIIADGGSVIMTADAGNALLQTVVNNTGLVQAQSLSQQDGKILLLGGFDGGTVKVGGTLDASAPNDGNGGFIETSGAHVQIADSATVTTQSENGNNGTWLIDPNDFTVAATGGNMTGAAVSNALQNNGNFIIQTATMGTAGGNGDININDAIRWSSNSTLTLEAERSVNINAAVTATGSNAGLAVLYSQGAGISDGHFYVNGTVNLPLTGSLSINSQSYVLIDSLAGLTNLNDHYALVDDIDTPVTAALGDLGGTLEGLGHHISNINLSGDAALLGLFNNIYSGASVRNLSLTGSVTSSSSRRIGLLAGSSGGTVANVHASGTVTNTNNDYGVVVGGLLGVNGRYLSGDIPLLVDSSANVTVTATTNNDVGGLVGESNAGTILRSHASGAVNVNGGRYVGGLAGYTGNHDLISHSYATGAVTNNGFAVGGLIGWTDGIGNAHQLQLMALDPTAHYILANDINASATNGKGVWMGGSFSPVGSVFTGSLDGLYHRIDNLYINRSNTNYVGLFRNINGGTVRNLGLNNVNITGFENVGALAGFATNPLINNVYVTGTVTGHSDAGGLVGLLTTTDANKGISDAYSAASVSGQSEIGGLVGLYQGNNGYITRSYVTGVVTGYQYAGGLVGRNLGSASIDQSFYATTNAGGSIINSDGAFNTLSTGKTLAQLKQLSTFSGWGGAISGNGGENTAWRIYDGDTTPLLRGFLKTLMVSATPDYNGAGRAQPLDNIGSVTLGSLPSGAHIYGMASASLLGASFALANDIDASGTAQWNGGAGFVPVGTNGNAFTGSFNGNDFAIDGLTINRSAQDYVGLFGYANGALRNVTLSGGSISGKDYVGALAGYTGTTGTVQDSHASANVNGSRRVGGLVGEAHAAIDGGHAEGDVTGSGNYVGGLVGATDAAITNSAAQGSVHGAAYVGGLAGWVDAFVGHASAIGTVAGTGNYVGGLIGYADANASVTLSHADGKVSGLSLVGGLVGFNVGGIAQSYATGNTLATHAVNGSAGGLVGENNGATANIAWSYAAGNVSGSFSVGGLVGANRNSASISESYAIGSVTGTVGGAAGIGGLVGQVLGGGGMSGFYATTDADGNAINSGGTITGTYTGNGNGTRKTYAELQQLSTFIDAGWDISDAGGDGKAWRIYDGDTTPLLRSFMTSVTVNADLSAAGKTDDGQTASGNANYTTSAPMDAGLINGSLNYASNSANAGSYSTADSSLYLGGLYSGQQGYDISYSSAHVTINKASATVTANSDTTTYNGQTQTTSGYSVSGLVNGEDASVLDSIVEAGGSGRNAGSYTHTVSGSDNNYHLAFVDGTLTINKATLDVSSTDATKTYDGTTTANGSAVVVGGQLFGSDSLSGGTFTYTDKNAGSGKTVITNEVSVNDGNNGNNYTLTYVANTNSSINKASATVTANSDTTTYNGQTQTTSGYSVSGLVNGEDASVLDSIVEVGGSGRNAGSYTHTISGSDDNYHLAFVDGTLTINKATLDVSSADATKTYDGTTAASGSAVVVGGQLFGTDSLSGGTFTYTDKNAGSGKTVITNEVSVNDGNNGNNYALTYVANTNSRIDKADLVITARDDHKVMSGQAYQGGNGINYQGLAQGDDLSSLEGSLSYSGSAQGAVLPSDYSIIVSGLSSDNYNIRYIDGELHITTNSQMEQAQQQAAAAQRKHSDWVVQQQNIFALNMDAGGGLRIASATDSLLSLQSSLPITTTLKELLPDSGTMVFPSESSNIDIEQVKKWLSALVDRLKASPDSKILVVGHTDNTGSERYNDYLSVERAEVIAHILQGMGVSPAQIEIRGLGFKHPLASNDTTTGRARNRRVDLLLP